MKKILFRKLLSDYMSFFLIALFAASIVVWVFQAVNFLDIIIEDGRDYLVYISYSLLNFPKIFSKLLPFVLFFSLFYVTIKYEFNNQLIIFWNFGVNKVEIINFILKISIILSILQIILTCLIVPTTQDIARSFLRNSNVNFIGNFIKAQKFNDAIKGVTIYSESKDKEGNLYNIFLKKDINRDEFEITYAKKGMFKQIHDKPILILYDGETIKGKKNEITNISFSKSDFSLERLNTNTTTFQKTQELSTIEIFKCIILISKKNLEKNFSSKSINNCSSRNFDNILKEFYKRFIIPLYLPILTLIPFLLIISSKENNNYFKIRIITFLLGLFFIIFSETTIRFISKILINNFFLISLPLIFFISLYLFFLKNFNYKIK